MAKPAKTPTYTTFVTFAETGRPAASQAAALQFAETWANDVADEKNLIIDEVKVIREES